MATLKMAIPNKGRLEEKTRDLLLAAGFKFSSRERALSILIENCDLEVLFARASDIPRFLSQGLVDLGITGEDMVAEEGRPLTKLLDFPFGEAELVLASSVGVSFEQLTQTRVRIATSFPKMTRSFCQQQNIDAEVVEMSGAVELSPRLGLADAIVDLVSTGKTLQMNGLVPLKTLLKTRAALFTSLKPSSSKWQAMEEIILALEVVLLAKEKKFLIANAPKERLEEIRKIVPGLRGPTLMSLYGDERNCSIQVVIDENELLPTIKQLKEIGVSGLLIMNIEKIIN